MWVEKQADFSDQTWRIMINMGKGFYQFPATAGISAGDQFTIDGKSYQVESTTSLRDEAIIAKVKEVKDDKPTSRRARSKSSGEDIPSEDNSGLDSSD